MKAFLFGKVRVQFLDERIVRLEAAKGGKFCDEDTLVVPCRAQFAEAAPQVEQRENKLLFGAYTLVVPEGERGLNGIALWKEGECVYRFRRKGSSGELPALSATPAVFPVADAPRIRLPKGGYTYRGRVKDSGYVVEERVQDVYLLLSEGDAKLLRKLFVQLTGRAELVRLATLGSWNSKYFAYSEESAKQVILDYEAHDVPLDNLVIDTDWRKASDRGIGYDIDTQLFPDMKRFLAFAHSHGVEIMFNDHPEPVEGAKSVFSPAEVRYREQNLTALMELGLDTWWYDRNWITRLISPAKGVHPETLGLYLFHEITKHFYERTAEGKACRRPVVMGNVDNIANGSYQGINSPASHRYSVQWTGDIPSGMDSIATEVENLLRGGSNCIPYVNADCGGHTGNPDKETFIRWMQFGALSPVFRPHCTKDVVRFREPWAYDEETLRIVREYYNLRYRLLPLLYRYAYESYEEGLPICRPLGMQYPQDKRALKEMGEYLIGDLLVAPVAGTPPRPVHGRCYVAPVQATYYNGTELAGEAVCRAEYPTLSLYCSHTAPEEGVPVYNFSARFETQLRFEEETELILRSDDGATVWVDGVKVVEDKSCHAASDLRLGNLAPGVSHHVVIEYFQAEGEATCMLYCGRAHRDDKRHVYLPEGSWMDLFDGKIYRGGRTVVKEYPLHAMPLFVRLGALIPLAYEAKNTREQSWDRLVFDYYPSRTQEGAGYLYEDDGESVAYKTGALRKSAFTARFDEARNAFVLNFAPAEGTFSGARAVTEREALIRFHLLPEADKIRRITVNGRDAAFCKSRRAEGAFPLSTGQAPDTAVLFVSVPMDVDGGYEIVFAL